MPIRVLIAEDNEDLRAVLSSLIDCEPDMRCVAETGVLDEVPGLVASSGAQVVVLDLELKGRSSLKFLPQLVREIPGARIVVFSGHAIPAIVAAALAAGASAYVLKSGEFDELSAAIRESIGAQ